MTYTTGELYEEHHKENREKGFSILKDERGELFRKRLGTGKRILDLGCRDGALTKYFAEGNQVLGVDVDAAALARAKTEIGIETRMLDAHGDWHELAGERFDAIVAGEVLEHLYYPKTIIRHITEHLKPGGIFVGSVPNAFNLKNRLRYLRGQKKNTPLEDPTHINQFSVPEMQELLTASFKEVEIIGLGRHAWFARTFPAYCAFDIAFVARV